MYTYDQRTDSYYAINSPSPYISTFYTYDEKTESYNEYEPSVLSHSLEDLPQCDELDESVREDYTPIFAPAPVTEEDAYEVPTEVYQVTASAPIRSYEAYYDWVGNRR